MRRLMPWTLMALAAMPWMHAQELSETPLDPSEGVLGPALALQVRSAEWTLSTDGPAFQATLEVHYRNPTSDTIEGVALLPAPVGALERGFVVDNAGLRLEGQVRSRDRALGAYGRITRPVRPTGRDPAVLERMADDLLRATIAPIPPRALVRIQVSYVGTARLLHEHRVLELPLPRTHGIEGRQVPTEISGIVSASEALPLLHAPGQTILDLTLQDGGFRFRTRTLQSSRGVATLYYPADPLAHALQVFTHGDASEDGYFLAEIDASSMLREPLAGANYLIAVDDLAGISPTERGAIMGLLRTLVSELGPRDRLDVWRTDCTRSVFGESRPVDAQSLSALEAHLSATPRAPVKPLGHLLAHFLAQPRDSSVPTRLVLATSAAEIDDSTKIFEALRRASGPGRRELSTFVIAMGERVQRQALGRLAEVGSGRVFHARSPAQLDALSDAFLLAVRRPVLRHPQAALLAATDTLLGVPTVLTFGETLTVSGRHAPGDPILVRLQGLTEQGPLDEILAAPLPESCTQHPWVATWWANQRMEQIRANSLRGESSESQTYYLTRLGERFGILSPETVSLALEPAMEAMMPVLVGPLSRGALSSPVAAAPPLPPPPDRGGDGGFLDRNREPSLPRIIEHARAQTEARIGAARPAAVPTPPVPAPSGRVPGAATGGRGGRF